jgi:NADH-quinone oxidoreductase subunit L
MYSIEYLLVITAALPLAATLLTAGLGRNVLKDKSHLPAAIAIMLAFVLSLLLLDAVSMESRGAAESHASVGYEKVVTLWTWAAVDDAGATAASPASSFHVDVALRIDPLTAVMLVMVTFISSLIVVYSAAYMHGDRGYWRFFTYISLFVFSMIMLVTVSNFLLLYVFWEAVGLCSYLLIGFWYQKPEAAAAGKKAFLVNRVGDFGFALGVLLIWSTFGTLNFHDTPGPTAVAEIAGVEESAEPAPAVPGVLGQTRLAANDYRQLAGEGWLLAICLLLFVGACGKSAQFPLHVWLPDAMEGPTPVSALIHAATMVTAGVYLVARCTPLFVAAPDAQLVVAGIGCFTALLAGLIALTQQDLKRVLAYSTVSQLGFMFLGLGAGTLAGITAGMFHLLTHAFFKALLFLGAGSVMHAMGGVIDMRYFGGLRRIMPTTHWTFLFGCLALAGVLPFAGFWSKDAILAAVQHSEGAHAVYYQALFWTALFTALLTAFYTFRAFFLTFYGEERVSPEAGHHAHESPSEMTVPLMVLAVCSLLVGAVLSLTGGFAAFLGRTPQLAFGPMAAHGGEHAGGSHLLVAVLSTVAALAGIAAAAVLYLKNRHRLPELARSLGPLYWLSYRKFYIDEIYLLLFVWPLRVLAAVCYAADRFLIDGLVDTIGRIPPALGARLRSLQIGLVPLYALAMMLGLLVMIGILLRWPPL